MKDRYGNTVKIGDTVRVLEIYKGFLDSLPEDEKPHIENMLGKEYVIDDFPEENKASVSIEWVYKNGDIGCGGLYMLSHEFELVNRGVNKK